MTRQPTANVIGLGLIGGSVALALAEQGFRVHGEDLDPSRIEDARRRRIVAEIGRDPHAEVSFVCTPVGTVAATVVDLLETTSGIVTDTGSVKAGICAAVDHARFVGGHPMAGSELEGLDGSEASMFSGAVWVLTPTAATADRAFAAVAAIVAGFGADVVALDPARHDAVVAVVSHVPHLTAATLMGLAASRAEEHAALLRLAAGGFRDMTRIASGHPAIWLDICAENRAAIVDALDGLIDGLGEMRAVVGAGDRSALASHLTRAREARANLPSKVARGQLAEVRIPIPDRPGAAAEVFTLAAELGVNIVSFEVVHSAEGERGVAIVLVELRSAELFRGGLLARGYRPAVAPLG